MIWLKTFGPWIAVVLAFVVAFQCGASRAKGKHLERAAKAEAATAMTAAELDQCHVILKQLREAIKASNQRVFDQAEEHRTRVAELQGIADAERTRLAGSYARALEEARSNSAELRVRIIELEPGEACLEVMKEIANELR